MLKKTVNGKTTTFAFDAANQLVSSTTDGVTTRYAYDAAGRMVREGNKSYRYGYLDKVMSVSDGDTTRTYTYHTDGQLASASCDGIGRAGAPRTPQTETFLWDGLALIQRGDEQFINEPHVGGGNPVSSSKGTSYFNDALGTTVGSKQGGKYSAAALTAFGERLDNVDSTSPAIRSLGEGWFTGKPYVEGLGHAFLMRNYRAGLAKWQTADPMGYPDGWNQLAYCGNGVTSAVDLWGCKTQTTEGKKYDDPAVHHSRYLWTKYDYLVGCWYNEYLEYDEIVHHHEYDIITSEDSLFDVLCDSVIDTGAKSTLLMGLAAGTSWVIAGVSAAVGAVPVTIVSLKLATDLSLATGVAATATATLNIAAAAADQIQRGKELHLEVTHVHDKQLETFNLNLRREYFE